MSKKKAAKHKIDTGPTAPVNSKKGSFNPSATASFTGLNSMTNWMLVPALFVPMIFSRYTMDPVIAVRYTFLSCFVFVFVLFFYFIHNKKTNSTIPLAGFLPRPVKLVFWVSIVYCIWNLIALSASINIENSYYETGRLLLNCILLWLIMQMVSREEMQVLKLCKLLVVVALVQSFLGIMQTYELAFEQLPGPPNTSPIGLMANRNLYGSAQVLIMPFVIYVLYKGDKAWKYISSAGIVGIIWSVLLSQTRSAWLALAVLMITALVLVLFLVPVMRKKWIIGTISGAVVIAAFIGLLMFSNKGSDIAKSINERVSSLTDPSLVSKDPYSSSNERLKIWKKTIQLIKEHPILGVGPFNWIVNISEVGTEGIVWAKGGTVPDRPHNEYLLVASETGIPGALLYILIWVLIVLAGIKVASRSTSQDRRILVIIMLAGLSAFAVDSLFSFSAERIEHSLYIFLMAGIILACYNRDTMTPVSPENGNRKKWVVTSKLALLFLAIAGINMLIGFNKFNFEKHVQFALYYEDQKNFAEELTEVEQAKNPFVTLDFLGNPVELRSIIAYRELKDYQKALEAGNKAKRYHPYNAFIYNNIGMVYSEMKDYQKAIDNYSKALKYTPEYDILFKNLGINYFLVNNDSACIRMLEKVDLSNDESISQLMQNAKKRLSETHH